MPGCFHFFLPMHTLKVGSYAQNLDLPLFYDLKYQPVCFPSNSTQLFIHLKNTLILEILTGCDIQSAVSEIYLLYPLWNYL